MIEDFRSRYLKDREAGSVRTLAEYLALFPGDDAAVAEAFLILEGGRTREIPTASLDVRGGIKSIGSYRVIREIGRGGQGSVYLAEDQRLGRRVALKVLTGFAAATDEALMRFNREAEVASRLEHHGICTVYEAGVEAGIPYIAMQYVEGETLARKIQAASEAPGRADSTFVDLTDIEAGHEPVDAPEIEPSPTPSRPITRGDLMLVVELIEKAARALHTAHAAGIIHRDIKPGNIAITAAGEPVILDFGLARELESDVQTLTRTGEIFGTPAYMAPEQIAHHDEKPDGRTDVYSLGVVLYECLTLRRPFEAPNNQALFQSILSKPVPDPRKLNPTIPTDLKVVLETALDKSRQRRYQTAIEFAEDLRRVRNHEPILARPIGNFTRLLRAAQRNPVAAASIALAILVIVGGIGFGAYTLGLADAERKRTEQAQGERDAALTNLSEAEQERDRLKAMMEALNQQNTKIMPLQVGLPFVTMDRSRKGAWPPPGDAKVGATERTAPEQEERADVHVLRIAPAPGFANTQTVVVEDLASVDPAVRRSFQEIIISIADAAQGQDREVAELRKAGEQLRTLSTELQFKDRKFAAALFARLGDRFQQVSGEEASADQAYARAGKLYSESGENAAEAAVALTRAQSLRNAGEYEQAAAELGRALHIFLAAENLPGVAAVSQNRGTLYGMIGRNQEAVEDLDRAAAIYKSLGNDDALAVVLCNKGIVLQREGKYEESCQTLEKGHELGSKNSLWKHESGQWVENARQVMEVANRVKRSLPKGLRTSVKEYELCVAAEVVLRQGKNLAAAKLFQQHLEKKAGPQKAGICMRAAEAAALVGLGVGSEASKLSDSDRTKWRQRALTWFKDEIASLDRKMPASKIERFLLYRFLRRVIKAPRLAPLREPAEVAKLPDDERAGWTEVWQDLRRLLK